MMTETAETSEIISTAGPGFVHLRVHSAYSLLEGALPFKTMISLAVEDRQPAIGIADSNNLFGALEFSVKAAEAGLQPLLGCQLDIDMEDGGGDKNSHRETGRPSIVLIVMDETGYGNLVELISRAYLDGSGTDTVHIRASWLDGHADGLICLTGGCAGPLDRAMQDGQRPVAEARLQRLEALFADRLYIELQRQDGFDRGHENAMLRLAYAHDIPIVATNEAFFPTPEDFDAHDALLAVAHNAVVSDDSRFQLTPDHHLKSRQAMCALFEDLPEALENTVEIARRCHFILGTRAPILPRFTGATDDPEEAQKAEADELRRQAEEGLNARLALLGCAEGFEESDYRERLEVELGIIERMGFPGYFLIVADFIKWAKAHDIPVGPGRGSGAGSLVAYALTVTDVDPLRFSLLFERFLNPERVSMPDFDIDFCQDRRDEVIRYVQEKYGREQVAQIITFGSLQARAALRDVGRVLEMPYGQVDRICKLVPNNPANPTPLHKAIEEEPKLREEADKEPVVARLLDIAQKLEGLYRHASTHAAGIVIGDRPLSQLVPMYRDPRSDMPVTQFNMKWVEQAGLVKFDFLGLKTLTVLKTAVDFLKERSIEIHLEALPLDDEKTYQMLSRGETVGVFQVESAGMRKALIGMRPAASDATDHLVQGAREGIQLVAGARGGDRLLEVGAGDATRGAIHLFEWAQAAPREQVAEPRGEQEHHGDRVEVDVTDVARIAHEAARVEAPLQPPDGLSLAQDRDRGHEVGVVLATELELRPVPISELRQLGRVGKRDGVARERPGREGALALCVEHLDPDLEILLGDEDLALRPRADTLGVAARAREHVDELLHLELEHEPRVPLGARPDPVVGEAAEDRDRDQEREREAQRPRRADGEPAPHGSRPAGAAETITIPRRCGPRARSRPP